MKNQTIGFYMALSIFFLYLIIFSIKGIYFISLENNSNTGIINFGQKTHLSKGEVRIKVGEKAKLGNYNIKLIAVTEDSRCPAESLCVWAGRLEARIYLDGDYYKGEDTIELFGVDKKFGIIKLINASPLGKSGQKLNQSDYVLTFVTNK
jgi:hypothetical protein